MCKIGDIIVIKEYRSIDDKIMKEHSFIVINDEAGIVKGLPYTFVASVMSSFKSQEQRDKI